MQRTRNTSGMRNSLMRVERVAGVQNYQLSVGSSGYGRGACVHVQLHNGQNLARKYTTGL